jgi:hypothetical protein
MPKAGEDSRSFSFSLGVLHDILGLVSHHLRSSGWQGDYPFPRK